MRKPVILFDLNGVLVDDENVHEAAFRQVLSDAGFKFTHTDYLEFFAGKTDKDGFEGFLRANSDNADNLKALQRDKQDVYARIAKDGVDAYHGAVGYVKDLKANGYIIGLVTGSRFDEVELILQQLDLIDCFDVVVTAEDVKKGKPSAEPFLVAAKALHVEPGACVVIEDSPSGIASARSAGMHSVAVATTHSVDELRAADRVLLQVDHLPDVELRGLVSP